MVVLVGTVLTPSASASTGDTKLLQGGVVVTANDPHLTGCQFTIQWSNFSTSSITYSLEGAPPSGNAVIGGGPVALDGSGFGQTVISFTPTNLDALTPHVSQGYHITLIGDVSDSSNNGKNKTFWIEKGCGATRGTITVRKFVTGNGVQATMDAQTFPFSDTMNPQNVGSISANSGLQTYTVTAGSYEITEGTLPANWALAANGLSCTDPTTNTTVDQGLRKATINVAVGETVACTWTNHYTASLTHGTITVTKAVTGTGASNAQTFAFTDDMPGTVVGTSEVGSISANSGTQSYTVTAGPYNISENTPPANWALDTPNGLSCTDPTSNTNVNQTTRAAAINVAVGETVACTWTNRYTAPIVPPPLVPDLAITKTGTPSSIPVGGTATYTLTVTNTGTGPATDVVVTDSMPAGLGFVSSTPGAPTCTNSHDLLLGTDTLTCQLGTLAAGDQTSVSIVVSGLFAGTFTNTAVVGPTDATPDDNTDSADTVVTPVEERPDEVLPSTDEKNEPKVLGERHTALPFTGLDVTRLGGLGVGLLLMGGLILLFDLRKRRVTGLG